MKNEQNRKFRLCNKILTLTSFIIFMFAVTPSQADASTTDSLTNSDPLWSRVIRGQGRSPVELAARQEAEYQLNSRINRNQEGCRAEGGNLSVNYYPTSCFMTNRGRDYEFSCTAMAKATCNAE